MITQIDVHNKDNKSISASTVMLTDYSDSEAYPAYVRDIPGVVNYMPGQFYKCEVTRIMAILYIIEEKINTGIIDGYVDLGDKPELALAQILSPLPFTLGRANRIHVESLVLFLIKREILYLY